MNHPKEYDERRPPSVEQRLTDYLCGELPQAEIEEIERALQTDPALAERFQALQATMQCLQEEALASPLPAALSAERRKALQQAFQEQGAAGKPLSQPDAGRTLGGPHWFKAFLVPAAAAALFFGLVWFGPERSLVESSGVEETASLSEEEKASAFQNRLQDQEKGLGPIRQAESGEDGEQDQVKDRVKHGKEDLARVLDQARDQGLGDRLVPAAAAENREPAGELNEIGYADEMVLEEMEESKVDRDDLRKDSIRAKSEQPEQAIVRGVLNDLGYVDFSTDKDGQDSLAQVNQMKSSERLLKQNQADSSETVAARRLETSGQPSSSQTATTQTGKEYSGPGDSVPPSPSQKFGGRKNLEGKVSDGPAAPSTPAAPGSPAVPGAVADLPGSTRPSAPSSPPPVLSTPAPPKAQVHGGLKAGSGSGGRGEPEKSRLPDGQYKRAKPEFAPVQEALRESKPPAPPQNQPLAGGGSRDLDERALGGDVDRETRSTEDGKRRGRQRRAFYEDHGELGDGFLSSQPAFVVHDGYGRRYHGRDILHHLRPCREREAPRDMFFRYYGDHPFVDRQRDALSTFALDVDTASYPLTRSYLQQGHLPPKEAVRTEEFLNYFDYQLAAPQEEDFAVQLDAFPSPFGHRDDVRMLRVALKAREVSRADRKPLSLVFVIDSSGSMADGNRLELVKRSLELLVDQLDDQDRVGIITFNSSARRVLDSTPGYERWKIREAIRQLKSGGSTNAEAGLTMGYEMSERHFREQTVNRVILCSDGVANSGETDQKRILDRVRSFSERQVDLTSIGVGMGNHNDVFLEQLANEGNGSCHYVDDFEEAKRVFLEQFTGTLQTVARDVKLQVEFGSSVKRWRQLGYENRSLADQDFRNDAVDAGEVGAGHQIVALYELEMAAEEAGSLATVRLRWKPDGGGEVQERAFSLEASATLSRFGLAQPRLRQAAVVAQFAEVLRRSYWARGDTYERLQEEVGRLVRDLPSDARVRELRDMVERARGLIAALPPQDELAQLLDEARRMRLHQAEVEQIEVQSDEVRKLLQELQAQNQAIEERLAQLLEQP
ncbi:MAG: DUF3520 domain-containing protein [Planctomycetota bacterium]|nr:MAG: DUF3520 domain-containing protein [Planctomycetota bacterium]